MKHIFLVLCIPLYAISIISAMRKEIPLLPIYRTLDQLKSQGDEDELYAQFIAFNQGIENEYFQHPWHLMCNWLPDSTINEEYAFAFISKLSEKLPILAKHTKLLNRFLQRDKDLFFSRIITYFIKLAQKNFDEVTYKTLAIIQNANQNQPTPQLNKLPFFIKKYVMKQAYNKIKRLYDITLSGHTERIRWIDFHAGAHVAATTSDDCTFRLWDLSTGKQSYLFPEIACKGYLKFNDDASELATATYQNNHVDIKIWDIASKTVLHSIQHKDFITGLSFLQQQPDENLLQIFQQDSSSEQSSMMLYRLEKDKKPRLIASTKSGPLLESFPYTDLGDYEDIQHAMDWIVKNSSYVKMTKNSRPLYLCERAAYTADNQESFETMKQAPAYQALTPCELHILNKISPKNSFFASFLL